MLGESIAHYKITGKLGEGGMGAVYRATDTKLNREVAIKVLPDSFASSPDRLARFTREAQVLASLNHPNIATIFGVEDKALVMELIEGNDLAGPLPLNEALHIARQIAEGLEAAHDKGIIHRDLKPANIKVTPHGVVKLLDFGLAKATDAASTPTSADSPTLTLKATQAGLIMGTAGYMSPEQAVGKTVDKRADIWAFGVVLHELLTGKKLFHGETVSDTLAAVLRDQVDLRVPQAPPPIQNLLARCLDRNLKHRLKDIGEARIAIEDFLANPKPQEPAKPRPTSTRPAVWVALAAALLVAITTTALWLRSSPPRPHAVLFNMPIRSGSWINVSPDGKWLLQEAEGFFRVRRLDAPDWQRLPGTEGASLFGAFWSEDSAAIGFTSAGRLRAVPLDGSPGRDLLAVQDFRGATWRGGRNDGTILLASNGKLKTLDLRSGTTKDLPLDFKAGSEPAAPVFLPEGDGFVFLQNGAEGWRLFRSSLTSPSIDPLFLTLYTVHFAKHPSTGQWHVFYFAGERELRASRILRTAPVAPQSGKLLSDPVNLIQGISVPAGPIRRSRFSIGDGGLVSWNIIGQYLPIWHFSWTDLDGKLLARLSENRRYASFALSPDESKIAAEVADPDLHIWILDSKTGFGARMSNRTDTESFPIWAPDGKSVFYVSDLNGRPKIERLALDNASKPELLWQSAPDKEGSLIVTLGGLSPEGRYLLVQTSVNSLSRLDLQAALPGRLEPVAEGEGYAALSPDGRALAWGGREGLAVQAYPPDSGPIKRFKRGADGFRPFFSFDGRTLYAHNNRELLASPLSPDRTIGEPRVLRPWFTSNRIGPTPAVASRDGKRLLLLEADETERLNTQILTDWTTLLPK